jgi:hypothetical protein
MTEELVEKLRNAVTYGYVPRLMREVAAEAADAIEALQAEIERLTFDGIHTCHDDCPRLPCVQRREIDGLRAVLRHLMNELQAHKDALAQVKGSSYE